MKQVVTFVLKLRALLLHTPPLPRPLKERGGGTFLFDRFVAELNCC